MGPASPAFAGTAAALLPVGAGPPFGVPRGSGGAEPQILL